MSNIMLLRDANHRSDDMAKAVRAWYEANRESWWHRRGKPWERKTDEFMVSLIGIVLMELVKTIEVTIQETETTRH